MNRIVLRGVVGRADVNAFNGSRVCNFSVVTEYSTKDKEGNSAMDTTWFNVSAWEGHDALPDLSLISKGVWVEVIGRIRLRRYTTQENEERTALDVIARSVKILPKEDLHMQPQRDY
ncbi:MAG: single-stranded DNA-binding protein [Bacteroidales bacterium]|nr:single-stranded DNA-binding protein [Bacteroidales bacterium]